VRHKLFRSGKKIGADYQLPENRITKKVVAVEKQLLFFENAERIHDSKSHTSFNEAAPTELGVQR
jgi:hypothetical protein